jgi:hypothetical protein
MGCFWGRKMIENPDLADEKVTLWQTGKEQGNWTIIAAALRKAKADGIREAAERAKFISSTRRRPFYMDLLDLADKIEKGEA